MKGATKTSAEPEGLATLRYQSDGNRNVVIINYKSYLEFMMKSKGIVEAKFPRAKAAASLKHINGKHFDEYAKDAKIWRGTVGAAEMLYVPHNSLVVESCSDAGDAVGMVVRGFFKDAPDVHKEYCHAWNQVDPADPKAEERKEFYELCTKCSANPNA